MQLSYPMYQFNISSYLKTALVSCCWLTIGSWIRIPLEPVSFTMQTFVLFLMAFAETPKQMLYSSLSYLALASLGLPVLSLQANPLWMFGKTAGYLVAFPLAGYWMSVWRQSYPAWVVILRGQLLILSCGSLWLAFFIGWQAAFLKGFCLFIPSALWKGGLALYLIERKNLWL